MTTTQPAPAVPAGTQVPNPPSNVSLIQVAAILAAGLKPAQTAHALVRFLGLPPGAEPAARAVLQALVSAHHSLQRADSYLSAYVVAGTRRVWADVKRGTPVETAMRAETTYLKQHENAQSNRQLAAHATLSAAHKYGPLLGWQAQMDSHTSAACRAAHGHNFYAAKGTMIGLPGAVHPNCRCRPTRPYAGAGLVDGVVGVLGKEAA